jgi:hypothetical protein
VHTKYYKEDVKKSKRNQKNREANKDYKNTGEEHAPKVYN